MQGTCHFYHKKWYGGTYGLGVFRKGIVLNDDLHIGSWNQLLIQMNGCNILFSHNLWFKIVEIMTEHGLL
jgi:hypothetical protein